MLIAFAMSLDAFSVALGVGCSRTDRMTGIKLAVAFGFFQFIMPLAGAFLGVLLDSHFSGTKYIAAATLFFIAFKMYNDARTKVVECSGVDPTRGFRIIILSVATSIDALCVGIPISMMQMNNFVIAGIIGAVCFFVTLLGFRMGKLCMKYVSKADFIGAAVLFAIGVKILVF